jgi:hypothetical protein
MIFTRLLCGNAPNNRSIKCISNFLGDIVRWTLKGKATYCNIDNSNLNLNLNSLFTPEESK